VAAACGDGSSDSSTSPAETSGGTAVESGAPAGTTLEIFGFAFSALSVPAGATVTIDNADSTTHTVTADDGSSFDVTVDGGATASLTAPSEPGRYAYHCSIHGSMKGTLDVTA
jgi:plastocyanin